MIKKIASMVEEAAEGVLQQVIRQSSHFAEIIATAYYTQGVRAVRRHLAMLFAGVFCVAVLAATVVVVPIALALILPAGRLTKACLVAGVGLTFSAVPLVFILSLFSEKRWRRFSGFEGIMEKLVSQNGSNPSKTTKKKEA